MKRKKAISLLHELKEQLDNPAFHESDLLLFQIASHVKDFFGDDSPEYQYITSISFIDHPRPVDTSEKIRNWNVQTATLTKDFIDRCIFTLKNKGLAKRKKPYNNFFCRLENGTLTGLLITAVSLLLGAGISVGRYMASTENVLLHIQVQQLQDSLRIIRTPAASHNTNDIPDNKGADENDKK